MSRRKYKRFDNTGIGFLAGVIIPIIIFFVVYLFENEGISFFDFIKGLWGIRALVKLGSLCVFANLLIFMGFIKLKFDKAARGVLGATIIYAIAVLASRAF